MQDQPYPTNPDDSQLPDYLRIDPVRLNNAEPDREAAANLIRQKVAAAYTNEPAAMEEAESITATQAPLSQHQQYMQSLNDSGKSWAEIQNAWHEYYAALPTPEKYQVWQEFHAANSTSTPFQQHVYQRDQGAAPATVQQPAFQQPQQTQFQPMQPQPTQLQAPQPQPTVIPADYTPVEPDAKQVSPGRQSVADIRKHIRATVNSGKTLKKQDHLKSLAFGLASGAVTVFIFLFGFFNEFFISPFIQPSRQASETPVIVDPASAVVGKTPKIIIPKINVEIPTDYSQTTTDNKVIEAALDNGIVHYPTTARPGTAGNAAYFGHSSNNILNPGKYKFAFVMLHKMVEGDTFYITYEGKAYAYEVISRRVVEPTEVGVLGPVPGQTSTATLITCDPPGTSLKRLVVVGKQISPDPSANPAPETAAPLLAATEPADLPGNGPTLWSRLWGSVF